MESMAVKKRPFIGKVLFCLSDEFAHKVDLGIDFFMELISVILHYADIFSDIYAVVLFHRQGTNASTQFVFGLLFLVLPIPLTSFATSIVRDEDGMHAECMLGCAACFGLYPLTRIIVKIMNWASEDMNDSFNSESMDFKKKFIKATSSILTSMPQAMLQLFSLFLSYQSMKANDVLFFIVSISLSIVSITYGITSLKSFEMFHQSDVDEILSTLVKCVWDFSSVVSKIFSVTLIIFILRWWSVLVFGIESIVRVIAASANGNEVLSIISLVPHDPHWMIGSPWMGSTSASKRNINYEVSHLISSVTAVLSLLLLHLHATSHATRDTFSQKMSIIITSILCASEAVKCAIYLCPFVFAKVDQLHEYVKKRYGNKTVGVDCALDCSIKKDSKQIRQFELPALDDKEAGGQMAGAIALDSSIQMDSKQSDGDRDTNKIDS